MTIDINIDDLVEEFNLPVNTVDYMVKTSVQLVTTEIYRNWQIEATNALNSTRNEYINNLQIINISEYHNAIVLTGKLPNMIEKGASPFDMKEGFEKSKKIKYVRRKDINGNITLGWYLTIPFRHGTPGIVGENAAFSGIMPEDVYKVIKRKDANVGLKKSEIPFPHNIPSSRKEIVLPTRTIPEYKHKSSIYEGLMKKSSAYEKVIQNTYISFRRVSDKSDPNSWIHKGIQAYELMPKAVLASNVETIVENNIDNILERLGYGE